MNNKIYQRKNANNPYGWMPKYQRNASYDIKEVQKEINKDYETKSQPEIKE